jgi:single-strand DNA-binding protein
MNVNKCICTGRLTKDPELKALASGTSVCKLRLAVDGMGRGREVGYINVSVFGKAGEAATEYL